MSRESDKGNSFAQMVADYLATVTGDERIERRVNRGVKDRGDIAGVIVRKRRAVIECKNCKRMDLSGWVDEAEVERGNDDAEYGIVIHKRKGKGAKHFGENDVTMTLETFAAIIQGGHEYLEDGWKA